MRYHIMYSSKGDNRSVYIASSYRNEDGQSRKSIVRRCGNLKKLLAVDPQALEKIKDEVRILNENAAGEDIRKRLLSNETIEADIIRAAKDGIMLKGEKPCLRGLGMVVLDRLWNELNLPYKLSYLKKDSDIEFDFEENVEKVCKYVDDLQNRRYNVVLAHPERYTFIQKDPEFAYFLAQQGCVLQVNKGSVFGQFGSRCRNLARQFMDDGDCQHPGIRCT